MNVGAACSRDVKCLDCKPLPQYFYRMANRVGIYLLGKGSPVVAGFIPASKGSLVE